MMATTTRISTSENAGGDGRRPFGGINDVTGGIDIEEEGCEKNLTALLPGESHFPYI